MLHNVAKRSTTSILKRQDLRDKCKYACPVGVTDDAFARHISTGMLTNEQVQYARDAQMQSARKGVIYALRT